MRYNLSLRKSIVLIAMVVIGLVGCASPSPTAAPSEEPTPVPSPNLQGDQKLSSVKFDEPKATEISGSLSGFLSSGPYTNSLSQDFTISVTGQQAQSITDYTSSALFYLEALPSVITEKTQGGTTDSSFADKLLAENAENLLIEVKLAMTPEEITKNFPQGYDIYFDIDPKIAMGITHDYRKYCRNFASAKIWMELGEGTVTGNLYKNNISTGARTVSSPNNKDLPAPITTLGVNYTYDLAVTGAGTASVTNKYRVSGTWNLGYNDAPPSGGGTPCP